MYGSVALGAVTRSRCDIVTSVALPRDARSARTLAPAISAALADRGWRPDSLATVAVAAGPGSFTGLRVGVTTAKVFAWGVGAAILAVDTLDTLARGAAGPTDASARLWAVLEAQRDELFVARFEADAGVWRRATPTHRLLRSAFAASLAPGDRVAGPLAAIWGGDPAEPTAADVLHAAHDRWRAGGVDSVFSVVPAYHRASAAEEKRAGR